MIYYHAIQMALSAHEKQIRKIDGKPYVAHPLEVGILLSNFGCDEETIIAGILHDTVEDSYITLKDIEDHFGNQVRHYVDCCTEKDKTLDWHTRKKLYLEQIEKAPIECHYIIAADKISNLTSISEYPSSFVWDSFNAGFSDQKWFYTSVVYALKPIEGHPLFLKLSSLVHEIFHV